MSKIQLLVLGCVQDATGYGENSRNIVWELHKTGKFNIQLKNYKASHMTEALTQEQADAFNAMIANKVDPANAVSLSFLVAPQFIDFCKWNVGYTTFETNKIPLSWLYKLNRMDAVCVPSDQNMESFMACGATSPIHVVPHGISYSREEANLPGLNMFSDKPTFVVSGSADHRKGLDIAIAAFLSEFKRRSDARLVIKLPKNSDQGYVSKLRQIVFGLRNKLGYEGGEIVLIAEYLNRDKMAKLYRSATAFVLPSRGEGWGLAGSEAVSLGVPVIATGWSGPMMYIPDTNHGYHIDYTMVPVSNMGFNPQFFMAEAEGHLWAEPDINSLSRQMRDVISNPAEAKRRAANALEYSHNNFTWDKSAEKLANIIEEVVNKQ